MSLSIYYSAEREQPLTKKERKAIDKIIKKYSVDKLIEAYLKTGEGLNWESFNLYEESSLPKGAVLEGATKLADNSEDASWISLQHWAKAISEIRRILPDADWDVTVESHKLHWDEQQNAYDPSK